jgi:hypothetical protein
MMKNREVSGSVVFANAAVILVKGDVEHPVQAVLNLPVAANRVQEMRGFGWEAGDVVAGLYGSAVRLK